MSARLKRRSRTTPSSSSWSSSLDSVPVLFTLPKALSNLDEVLPQRRPWAPLFRRVATRELRQLRDCVIRPRRRRRVARAFARGELGIF